MKCFTSFTSAAVVLCASTVFAQTPAAGQKVGLATSLQRGYAGIKANFTAAADKMPEADYNFKPGIDAGSAHLRPGDYAHRAEPVRSVLGPDRRAEPDGRQESREGI